MTQLAIAIDLGQLSVLMNEYLNQFDDDDVMRALTLSSFLVWAHQRQQQRLNNLIQGEFHEQTNRSRS